MPSRNAGWRRALKEPQSWLAASLLVPSMHCRYLMEEMIPELEEMVSKGYFTRSEIKVVAQKRQDFEYALKRRAALKKDYLR